MTGAISFENGDNFIRNMVTVSTYGGLCRSPGPRLTRVSTGDLPVDPQDIMRDLRVDDPEEDLETVTRLAKGACAFIEKKTGYCLLPTVFELTASHWWTGSAEVLRGPFRQVDSVSYLAGRDDQQEVDPDAFWARQTSGRSFALKLLPDFDRPALWQAEDCISVRFSCGFDEFDNTGDLPIDDGLLTVLTMVTGHYYQNREMLGIADAKYGLAAVELGATSLLGQYRQFW